MDGKCLKGRRLRLFHHEDENNLNSKDENDLHSKDENDLNSKDENDLNSKDEKAAKVTVIHLEKTAYAW